MPSIGSLCVIINLSIIHFIYTAVLKSDVSGTQKPTPLTVFNLQASDWVHCEEAPYYQLSRYSYKLVKKKKFKVAYFAEKNSAFQKIP